MSLSRFPDLLTRIERGTAAEEVPALERLAEAAPGHVTAHVALARACEVDGRWEAARRSWQRAHLLMPGSPAVRAGLKRTAHRASPDDRASETSAVSAPPEEAALAEPAEEETERVQERPPASTPAEPSAEEPSEGQDELERPTASFDDLDSLIEDLEGARIEPEPDPADAPPPNLESDVHDMVTPTLARIYERQKQYGEAARVYRRLADESPEDADEFRRKAEEMRTRAEAEKSEKEEGKNGGAEEENERG